LLSLELSGFLMLWFCLFAAPDLCDVDTGPRELCTGCSRSTGTDGLMWNKH